MPWSRRWPARHTAPSGTTRFRRTTSRTRDHSWIGRKKYVFADALLEQADAVVVELLDDAVMLVKLVAR
jgi:hypothetical protein